MCWSLRLGLGVTWRLLRDHLDKYRALLGLVALVLIPLYDIKTAILNANTVMIPFWAAALLFTCGLGAAWAFSMLSSPAHSPASPFSANTGRCFWLPAWRLPQLSGPGTRRFWRSPAPYVMALGAAIVIAPHVSWFVSERGGTSYTFMRDTVVVSQSFGAALLRSVRYLVNCVATPSCRLFFSRRFDQARRRSSK